MPVVIHEPNFPRLPPEELAAWAKIPTTIIVDDTDGAAFVDPDIRALPQGVSFAGQALTIEAPPADISAVHHALPLGWPGAVMMIAADGRRDTAMVGEIVATSARHKGFHAIVVDGAVRDPANLRKWPDIPVFCRSTMARGPYRQAGGVINGTVQFGGISVEPGSLVIGDDDGLAIVPLAGREALFEKCRAHAAFEDEALARVATGETTIEIFDVPPPDKIGG